MQAARRLLHVLLIVLILLIGTAAATAIVSQTAWFKNRVRVYVIAQASKSLNGDIKIDRLGGNLFSGLELEGISIWIEGQPVVSVKDIGLRYNLYQLITSNMTIDELRVNEPVLRVEQDGEGWTIAQLIKKQESEANREGPLAPMRIDDIGISNGSILVAAGVPGVQIPKRVERIDAKLSFAYAPVHYSIAIDHVSFRASEPELALNSFSGAMAIRDDTLFLESIALRTAETSLAVDGAIEQYLSSPVLKLTVTSDKTSVPEIAQLVPAVAGIALQPAFEFRLSGPLDRLGVDMNVRSSAGQIVGTLTTDLAAPGYAASGNVSVQHLNLAPLVNDAKQASDITAQAAVDLRSDSLSSPDSLSGTIKLDANKIVAAGYVANRLSGTATLHGRRIDVNARTAAYGATASAAGRVVVPEGKGPLSFDLRGQARHLNAAALPSSLNLPSVKTEVNADYHVVGNADVAGGAKGQRAALVLDATLADSSVANAKILSGSTVRVDARQSALAYAANATVQDVDLQQIGSAFGVTALADDRYRSRIDGHVELEGRGTTIKELDARASGTIANASLVDGQISNANFDASIANNRAHLTAAGTFADLDPARVSDNGRLQGNVGGQFDLDATAEDVASGVTLDSVSGTAKLALGQSTVGKIAFDHATLDADYQQRTGEIRQLEIVGPDANVSAHGTLALGDTGNSNLTFHADSPRLAEIGSLFDVPVAGIGSVDGTVTGNRTELKAAGHLTGDGITISGERRPDADLVVHRQVPDLDFKRAEIDADSKATFVEVAGQQIDELSGTATYAGQRVGFDLTAAQPKRSAKALRVAAAAS